MKNIQEKNIFLIQVNSLLDQKNEIITNNFYQEFKDENYYNALTYSVDESLNARMVATLQDYCHIQNEVVNQIKIDHNKYPVSDYLVDLMENHVYNNLIFIEREKIIHDLMEYWIAKKVYQYIPWTLNNQTNQPANKNFQIDYKRDSQMISSIFIKDRQKLNIKILY